MTLSLVQGVADARLGRLEMPTDASTWQHLQATFEAAVEEPTALAMITLRTAVMDFAATVKRESLPPERAVIALKTLLIGHGHAGWTPSLATEAPQANAESAVYAKIFSWFVTALFER